MKTALRNIADCIIGIALSDLTTAESKIYYILAAKLIVFTEDRGGEAIVVKGREY